MAALRDWGAGEQASLESKTERAMPKACTGEKAPRTYNGKHTISILHCILVVQHGSHGCTALPMQSIRICATQTGHALSGSGDRGASISDPHEHTRIRTVVHVLVINYIKLYYTRIRTVVHGSKTPLPAWLALRAAFSSTLKHSR